MGKAKKRALHKSSLKPYSKPAQTRKLAHSIHKTPQNSSGIQQRPIIPFESHDNILLVGEGDFSFSRSLLEHHNCASVYATSYDTRSAVLSKYPQAAGHTKALEEENCKIEYGVDATKIGRAGGSGGSKGVRKRSWNKIVFNFPHVGGLTKDVNRQVRANQELIVGFFKSALPLLSPTGQIIVTVFEGQPYELWNIRDLARHIGLKVGRSFKFQPIAYPGYKHARTLGNIEGGGGWKGEDRAARTYIFESNDAQRPRTPKEKTQDESDSEGN